VKDIEQLNIVGKRSGDGFIAHKAMLVSALSRALAERAMLMDFTIGRKGLLGYLKALGGSNIVKVTPSASASGTQANGHKRLKVTCGANTSYLEDLAWIKTEGKRITPLTICEVRVSPSNTVKPNVGAIELAEALNRVLPFTAKGDDRPVLSCVLFEAKEGKLTLVSADGFRLAVVSLDYEDGEGQALITREDLRGIPNALRRAKRARVSFEGEDVTKPSSLILDTELIRYKWTSYGGSFPEWQKLVPTEFNTSAHFDTVEANKAVNSLKALSDNPKAYPIDITIGEGKMVMTNPDSTGEVDLLADTDGQGFIRVDGKYLTQALKACGGMVDLSLSNPISPMLFSLDGYRLVVMPMLTDKAKEWQKANQAESKAEPTAETRPTAEPVGEQSGDGKKPKGKRRAKQPVTA
jgi:DNA polymerase-3 subunit beta